MSARLQALELQQQMRPCVNCRCNLETDARYCSQCGVRSAAGARSEKAGTRPAQAGAPARGKASPSQADGLYLQVHLCGLRLQSDALDRAPSSGGLRVAFRFGIADEVTAAARLHEDGSQFVSYLLGSAHVSTSPIWGGGAAVADRPSLSSLHFHLWHGEQLLGLAALPLPTAGLPEVGGFSGCLLCQDVEICSLRAGSVVGHIRIALHAGPAAMLKAQQPHPASLPALTGAKPSETPESQEI